MVGEQQDKDASGDLALWLSDVGRRTWRPAEPSAPQFPEVPAESSEVLIGYLQEVAGREFRTREDIRQYVVDLSEQERDASGVHRRRRVMKDTVLLLALVAAYIQYHFLDVNLQIARLPTTLVFVPVEATAPPERHRVELPRGNGRHATAIS